MQFCFSLSLIELRRIELFTPALTAKLKTEFSPLSVGQYRGQMRGQLQ